MLPLHRPLPQSIALSQVRAFLDNLAIRRLDAEIHAFLVNIESDIVSYSHGVLLYEVFEPALHRRSRHSSLWENPFS